MKLVLERLPHLGPGWWWELRWQKAGGTRRVVHGYAFTKRGAIHAAKRRSRKEQRVGERIEMEL
jgi:hypothetical protein